MELPLDILNSYYAGKVLVDTEFSDKGDRNYYESIGVDYPGFDGTIIEVTMTTDNDGDPMFKFETTKGIVDVHYNEGVSIEEKGE